LRYRRRASSTIVSKELLFLNYWTNFYQISQKCSFGPHGPLSPSFKLWPPGANWPASRTYQFFVGKSLKIFSETTWPISSKFHRHVPWIYFFQIPSNYVLLVQNGPTPGLIVFHWKLFNIFFFRNYWADFLVWYSFRFLQIMTPSPYWPRPRLISFLIRNSLKIF